MSTLTTEIAVMVATPWTKHTRNVRLLAAGAAMASRR
jgi:hypothetical protein